MEATLMTAKELAREIPIGEHKIRSMAKKYPDFPKLRNGNRLLFIKEEVVDWLAKYSRQLIKIESR